MAHHGIRSGNPTPCYAKNVQVLKAGTILVSHLNQDAIGGVLALMGQKMENPAFWEGAEMIDVKGQHNLHELETDVQDKLNAFYAVAEQQEKTKYSEITDVTDKIEIYRLLLKE